MSANPVRPIPCRECGEVPGVVWHGVSLSCVSIEHVCADFTTLLGYFRPASHAVCVIREALLVARWNAAQEARQCKP